MVVVTAAVQLFLSSSSELFPFSLLLLKVARVRSMVKMGGACPVTAMMNLE